MSNAQDVALTIAKETTYGTPVTVTQSYEFLSESLDFSKNVNDSPAYRYGARVASSAGRVLMTKSAGGDVSFELGSKGFGKWFEACLGTVTSTKVGATTVYQQVHTIGDVLPSLTVQKILPSISSTDSTFSDGVFTFTSAMVASWSLDVPEAGVATFGVTLNARDVTTATAKVTPSYLAASNVLHFGAASLTTGAVTAPTATALASAPTSVANVKSFKLNVDNALEDAYFFGGAGLKAKPRKGRPEITGEMTVEFVTNGPFVTAFLTDAAMTLIAQIGTTANTDELVQIVLSDIRITGELPKAGGTPGVVTMTVPFKAYANGVAAQPLWLVSRTYETAV